MLHKFQNESTGGGTAATRAFAVPILALALGIVVRLVIVA